MFTIQYEGVNGQSYLQTLDSKSRTVLVSYLAKFGHPIQAIYEQASPITKTIRKELLSYPGTLSRAAREFINSRL